ncbi:MAG: formylmethanofuran dehydrogenase [Deltaproteobacteria bacterium]|nr:formylmethanofuran dehydrogenase [Deltaproteobacteria bacterium]MBW2662068.1 formylmethanofuran dehydrogenase [Deltaproteobacteria bacterium]
MNKTDKTSIDMPEDLRKCIAFHGHQCPGLAYGYLIAKQAINILKLKRAKDEEVVVVCENDSCAVDALQVLLGTTAGKGNLIINNYGKNAYTIFNRSTKQAYRFSRKQHYIYKGKDKEEFARLDAAISAGSETTKEKWRQKYLKSKDLFSRPFDEVFSTSKVEFSMPPYAPLARSKACDKCGEMTMSTKMVSTENGKFVCIPCSKK